MSEQTAVLGELVAHGPSSGQIVGSEEEKSFIARPPATASRARATRGGRPWRRCGAGNAAVTQDLSHLRKRRSRAASRCPRCGADDGPRSFRASPLARARTTSLTPCGASPRMGRSRVRTPPARDAGVGLGAGMRRPLRPRRTAGAAAPRCVPCRARRSPLSSSRCRRGGGRRPRRLVVRGGRAAPRLRNHACRSHGVDHSSPTAPQPARSQGLAAGWCRSIAPRTAPRSPRAR